ncbi:DNA cytosine methyltransferase [Vibrio antiquarius]|uniref:DNA cytosine methyltransferase n=1 Tax=Vibrio diabolicus subgroup TaxID=2315253 RepID=UPI0026582980|nr:DNA cytosine methyltransferase [Vibrio antiquarius]MCR9938232.1 DNA cytosine methyltransferase [Vibrio antiquarius]HCG6086268.1 DNA cytosine methyltransferase [Vibrio parahaemolyticus]
MKKAISLFSSSGIGELGIKSHDIEIIVANELHKDRCQLYSRNYPETTMIQGDIWGKKTEIISQTKLRLEDSEELFLIYATPPCQGMSTNGAGKLRAEIEAGRRPKLDERNLLVIPAMDIIVELEPKWVVFENVPGMRETVIPTEFGLMTILDYMAERLGKSYTGTDEIVSCSDYGVPQLRKRLITVFTKCEKAKKYIDKNGGSFFSGIKKSSPITLEKALVGIPSLDAVEGKNERKDFHPLHYVNVMKEEKYWWVQNTPSCETAFNNQCVNPSCNYQGNQRHFEHLSNGKWVSAKNLPINCEKCGSLLPRPTIIDPESGEHRMIKGFHSAYRRMDPNKPSRAITINYPYEASDNKIHPYENRVLSTYEVMKLQTITNYDYKWDINGKMVSRALIAKSIGESVPPKLLDVITRKIMELS